jgi:hypothetical protein
MREAVDLRQPETGPLAGRLGGEERIEHLGNNVGRDADPGVLDLNGNEITLSDPIVDRCIAGSNGDGSAAWHGIARIDQKVDQCRIELGGIDRNRPDIGIDIGVKLHQAAEPGIEDFPHRMNAFGKIDGHRIDALPAGECEQLACQRCAPLRCFFDCLDSPQASGVTARQPFQRMDVAGDDHQEIVEIMRHAAGELAQCIELLRLRQLPLDFFQVQLGFAAFGNVTGNLGKADKIAVIAANGIDYHTRPEEAAVLADAPAFFVVATMIGRELQGTRRAARGLVGLGIKSGKMLPDDFLRQIPLDALSADVPVGDDAVRVQHVKRIVRNAADKQAKLAFTCVQRRPGPALFGNVARDLGKADQPAVLIDGVDDDGSEKFRAILAQPPAFRRELSLLAGSLQGARGFSCLPVLRQIKHSEVPADDLAGFIALDAPGAGIPAADHTIGIEHVDGIIDDPIHQQPKTALALV